MWARITGLEAALEQLLQRQAAYDTLVAAGEEKQRRALGLESGRPPRHRRSRGHLAVIPSIVLLALTQSWTSTHGRHT